MIFYSSAQIPLLFFFLSTFNTFLSDVILCLPLSLSLLQFPLSRDTFVRGNRRWGKRGRKEVRLPRCLFLISSCQFWHAASLTARTVLIFYQMRLSTLQHPMNFCWREVITSDGHCGGDDIVHPLSCLPRWWTTTRVCLGIFGIPPPRFLASFPCVYFSPAAYHYLLSSFGWSSYNIRQAYSLAMTTTVSCKMTWPVF